MFNQSLPPGGLAAPQRGMKPGIGMKRPFPKPEPPRMSPIRPGVPGPAQPAQPGMAQPPMPPTQQQPPMPAPPNPGAAQPPVTSPGFMGQPMPSPGQRQLQPTPPQFGYTTPGFRPGDRPVPDGNSQQANQGLHQVFMERARQMGIGDKEINKFLAAKLRPVNVKRRER